MSNQLVVHKGRTNTVIVNMGIDVSGEDLYSQIRTEPELDATLIADWDVSFLTDGVDGKLVLVLDDTITSEIAEQGGYMDVLRISGGEPVPVFDRPLEVVFRGTVTVEPD
jgi:hypothetical protein